MLLITIEVYGRPTVVMSANVEPLVEDHYLQDPNSRRLILETNKRLSEMEETLGAQGGDLTAHHYGMALMEIEEAVDTWLGTDLRCDCGWKGVRNGLNVRPATPEEKAKWRASLEVAWRCEEQEPGDQDWVLLI